MIAGWGIAKTLKSVEPTFLGLGQSAWTQPLKVKIWRILQTFQLRKISISPQSLEPHSWHFRGYLCEMCRSFLSDPSVNNPGPFVVGGHSKVGFDANSAAKTSATWSTKTKGVRRHTTSPERQGNRRHCHVRRFKVAACEPKTPCNRWPCCGVSFSKKKTVWAY